MEARRRQTKSTGDSLKLADSSLKASDDLPLPLYLVNAVFFTLFFSVVYFLLLRWREKIRNSTPLHLVTLSEIAAIATFIISFVYLLGFFGVGFIQSLIIPRAPLEDLTDDEDEISDLNSLMVKEDSRKIPCAAAFQSDDFKVASPKPSAKKIEITDEQDEEIVESVVKGKIASYALESKVGDCRRAAAIRREALQRITGKSLEGLPLEGFDYESILGQCCEMPVGYVQIPVGIAGPLYVNSIANMITNLSNEQTTTTNACKLRIR